MHAGIFFNCHLFFNVTFSPKLFQEVIDAKSSNQDHDRHYVSPDLRPNCLQILSADDSHLAGKVAMIPSSIGAILKSNSSIKYLLLSGANIYFP